MERFTIKLQSYGNVKRINMKKLLGAILLNFLFFNNFYSLIEVDITRGNLDPLPIAFHHYT